VRGLVLTGDIVYNLIFGIGLAWDEPGRVDDGWSRASVPFAISERNANCVLNGLMLFGYKSDGSTTAARFQITQETCQYFKVDYWGQLAIVFVSERPDDPRFAAARQVAVQEEKDRYPTQPLANLAARGVDPSVYGKTLTQTHVTARGVVYDGVSYMGDCITRTGNYAGHCPQMVLPSYSTAKGIFAGLAMMRLAERFGTKVYGELIKTWLPAETAAARGDWDTVSVNFDIILVHFTRGCPPSTVSPHLRRVPCST